MADQQKVQVNATLGLGSLWFTGWLFSVGYVGLDMVRGVIALLLWPYFLGAYLAEEPGPLPVPPAVEQSAPAAGE